MFEDIPVEIRNATPGMVGSAIALFFVRRPMFTAIGIFIGGCLLAYFGTHWAAKTLNMESADGLVGFLLGLFGMALLAKIHDTIEAISPTELWGTIKDFIRKRLGV